MAPTLFGRLGLVKSRGGNSSQAEQKEAPDDEETYIKSILIQNEALDYAREVNGDDLLEMGITDKIELETAWRILRETTKSGNIVTNEPTKNKSRGSPSSSTKKNKNKKGQNKGLLSQDGLAWYVHVLFQINSLSHLSLYLTYYLTFTPLFLLSFVSYLKGCRRALERMA